MEQRKTPRTTGQKAKPSATDSADRGWKSRNSKLSVEGEIFFLTFPFIDQALALKAIRTDPTHHPCDTQTVCRSSNSCGRGGRRHGQTENQAELSSPSASAARPGSLQSGGAQQPRLARAESMSTLSTNSLHGTAPSPGSPSIASSWFAIACTSNHAVWPRTPSTSNSLPCAG